MKKAFTLPTCKTCQRIFDDLQPGSHGFEVIDIKSEGISAEDLDHMAALAGSYEALFSRRAMKFRSMGLADQNLEEQDYRRLILEEYTFLKRPVLILDQQIFIGNTAKVIEAAREALLAL